MIERRARPRSGGPLKGCRACGPLAAGASPAGYSPGSTEPAPGGSRGRRDAPRGGAGRMHPRGSGSGRGCTLRAPPCSEHPDSAADGGVPACAGGPGHRRSLFPPLCPDPHPGLCWPPAPLPLLPRSRRGRSRSGARSLGGSVPAFGGTAGDTGRISERGVCLRVTVSQRCKM